jgi:outer membrane protein, heavy metal efflux system
MSYGGASMVFLLYRVVHMNRVLRYFLYAALSTLPLLMQAKTLEANKVVVSLDKNFPIILAAQADIKKAKANLLAAQGGFDSMIKSRMITSTVSKYKNFYSDTEVSTPIADTGNTVFTGYRLGIGDFPVYDQSMSTHKQGELRAGIEIPWLRDKSIDSRRANILISRSSIEISEKEFDLKKLQVIRDAVFSYWDWYIEGNKLLIQQQLLALAKDRDNIIKYRFEKGDAPELDLVENQRIITQREIFLTQQTQSYQKALLLLSLYYRDIKGHPILPTIEELPRMLGHVSLSQPNKIGNTDFSTVLTQHPLMQQLAKQRSISYTDLALARNNLKPKLSNRIYFAKDFGQGESSINKSSVNLEFSFEVPINRRRALGEIHAAKSTLEQIEQNQKMFSDRLSINLQNSKNQIEMADSVTALTKKELAAAKKLEDAEKIKYAHGDSNLFLVNLREQSTAETETKLVTAWAEQHKARQEYFYITGTNRR